MFKSAGVSVPCGVCCKEDEEKILLDRFEVKVHFSILNCCIRELRCTYTGIRVFACIVASPICNLNITFKTETHTNEGLPHTLEHLVFLGSKNYPYKVNPNKP